VAAHVLNEASVESVVRNGTVDLTVIAIEGTDAPGASIGASGPRATSNLRLETTEPTSLVFAVGADNNANAPSPAGWVVASRPTGAAAGTLGWVEYTNQPTGSLRQTVRLPQAAQAAHGWVTAAVELPGDGG
jgi:hypothetical protein